ncbi:MAG: IS1380 family transposase, partial [Ignavibacteriales bacterium]|nr:IS1380 family transposase [Ignavibacteriales bacterium]
FKLERTEEELTAHGGLALMAEYNHGLKLREWVDRSLPAPGSNRGYSPSVFVDSLVLMLQGGGKSLEDLRVLERESALMRLMGVESLPDPDTAGDWLRRMGEADQGQAGLIGLGQVRDKMNQRILRRDRISEYTLDADATQIEAEKREARWTYQKVKGYMPMLGFLFETGICLYDEFREGNVAPQAGQLEFYRQCKQRMSAGKRIGFYRADSASYQAELINALEADQVFWAITADQDCAVKEAIKRISPNDWKEPEVGCGYQVVETVHTMNKTGKAFRLIVKREIRRQVDLYEGERYFYHAVATNWPTDQKNAFEALTWHNQRGQAENFNKELKSGFGLERMPCGQFGANAVFFRIGVIAYNLFIGFKRLSCPAAWAHHTIATFRWKWIQVAGRIVRHAGRVILKLMVDAEQLALFCGIRQKCFELTLAT